MLDNFTHIYLIPVLCALWLLFTAGCMTPERALRETDEIGNSLASEYQNRITGGTNTFNIARPSDRLRRQLERQGAALTNAIHQAGSQLTVTNNTLILTLDDALIAGARNSNEYQASKEKIFGTALDLQLQRHAFENTFAGILGGGLAHDKKSGGDSTRKASGDTKGSVSRKLKSGATITSSLGLDIIRLLTGDRGSTLGIMGDATIKIPLLRGAGKLVTTEPLTKAERNLIYAVYDFETFRQNYAVKVASGYYNLLEVTQRLQALEENQERLSQNYRRAEMLFEAGRMSQVELDQTRQDLLRTGDQLVTAQQSRQKQLDSFKISLGLPVDSSVEIDRTELERLSASMRSHTEGDTDSTMPPLPFTEAEAISISLTNRHDLILSRYRLEDAKRALKIAENALRPDLSLTGGGSVGRSRTSGASSTDQTDSHSAPNWDFPGSAPPNETPTAPPQ